jgi:hypothetical protein
MPGRLTQERIEQMRLRIEEDMQASAEARLAIESIDRVLENSRAVRRSAISQLIAKGALSPDTPLDAF